MTTADFRKVSPIACSFDAELGVCVGWACFSKKDGVDYVDAHGDHFPDVELFKAVDALNRVPVEQRAINVEHAGPDRGVIVSAFALTEDFAKAANPKIDTGGTYGVLVTFKPDAELLKSIKDGDAVCLSIEGKAHDVETIAKSASADIAAAAHKRTMRKVELTKLAVVKAGAHEGAAVAIVKGAPADPIVIWKAAEIAKRAPALTSPEQGHQHAIYDVEERDGSTSYERGPGSEYGHSHPWVRLADGSISIGMVAGHTHSLANPETATMADDLAKSITAAQADVTKARGLIATAIALPPEQMAFAKRLDGAALEAFLGRTDADRAAMAAPIHKSERTGRTFFKGEEALVELAKDADATHAELAKARDEGKTATIAKAVAAVPLVKGASLIVKAIHLLPDAERAEALADLATVNASLGVVTKSVGRGASVESDTDPKVVLEKAAAAFAKSNSTLTAIEARREFGRSEEGQRLYAEAYPLG